MKAKVLVFLATIGILTACTNAKTSTTATQPTAVTTTTTDTDGTNPIPPVSPSTGQLVLELEEGIDPTTVEGYLVGYEDQFKLQKADGDKFYINNVPTDEKQDLIITANSLAVSLTAGSNDRGKRINDIEFFNGAATDKGKIDVPKTGSISGKVTLIGGAGNLGIDVFIPGTSYTGKTDDDGAFTLSNIPVGIHNLAFMKDGYHTGRMENVEVMSEKTTTISDVTLAIDTGAEGFIMIEGGNAVADSRTVKLVIGASETAVLMQISESDTFKNASWIPLSPTFTFTFPVLSSTEKEGTGTRTLYIRFADANGLASAPFSDDILVDIFNDDGAISINNGATETALRSVTGSITVPKNAVKMKISKLSDLSDVNWEDVTTSNQILFGAPSQTGTNTTNTIYIQFQDKDGYYSEIYSDSIVLNMYDNSNGGISCTNSVDGSGYVTTRNLTFSITVPPHGTQMIFDNNAIFSNSNWESIATTKNYTTTSQGIQTYYIKFRDADNVEFTSDSWQESVEVNIFPASSTTINIASSVLYSKNNAPTYPIDLTHPSRATHIMVDYQSNFSSGNSWEAVDAYSHESA